MKAQVSLEIMVYMIILILMLSIVSYAAITRNRAIFIEKINMDARRVTKLIALEIDIAVSVGDGYQHTFLLPQYLYSATNYTVVLYPESQRIYTQWYNRTYTIPILTSNITGTVKKGINIIKNEKGLVVFE